MINETPTNMTITAPTTPATAPSSVLRGLIAGKNGRRPILLPTSSAAASLATTAKMMKSAQTMPCDFDE